MNLPRVGNAHLSTYALEVGRLRFVTVVARTCHPKDSRYRQATNAGVVPTRTPPWMPHKPTLISHSSYLTLVP